MTATVTPALKSMMACWRQGLIPLPKRYVALHRQAAEADLPRLCEAHGLRVLHTEMVSDGWMDGMKVLRVVCEARNGSFAATKLRDIRWSDSNGGSWFEVSQDGGGQSLIEKAPTAPGYL